MLYTVEIRRDPEHLTKDMSAIREWLDSRRFEPDVFRCDTDAEHITFRLKFKTETEADACAETFGGQRIR